MPIVNIKIVKGRSEQKKQIIVEMISKILVEELEVDLKWITILFDEYKRENWSSAGELHSIKFGEGFGKEINK